MHVTHFLGQFKSCTLRCANDFQQRQCSHRFLYCLQRQVNKKYRWAGFEDELSQRFVLSLLLSATRHGPFFYRIFARRLTSMQTSSYVGHGSLWLAQMQSD
jgi:hypothetical protein